MGLKIHNLYRAFDSEGNLLYAGISWTAMRRFQQHGRYSPWWPEVASLTLEQFKSRPEAERAEKAAIRAERPRYNRTYSVTGPAQIARDPALEDWQVLGAARNAHGTWDVDVAPPGGHPEMGVQNQRASTAAEAVQQALQSCAEMLAQEEG